MSVKLSIIVPVYNVEKYLKRCLDSIKNQTFQDWECILVDDGSTDKSGDICNAYSVFDPRFKAIHRFNAGSGEARNLGAFLAEGEWVAFPDSDDELDPKMYEDMLSLAAKYKDIAAVRCGIECIKLNGTSEVWNCPEGLYDIKDHILMSDPEHDAASACCAIYKKQVFKNIKFPKIPLAEDLIFNTEVYLKYKKVYITSTAYYKYYKRQGSLSNASNNTGKYVQALNMFTKLGIKYQNDAVANDYYKNVSFENFKTRKSLTNLRKDAIDLVIPYVDFEDEVWRSSYECYNKLNGKLDQEVNGANRFKSNKEIFKYVFRSIDKYLPFIDTIHLLVSNESQVPDFLDRNKIHVVLHSDFIPAEYLPTFNSCTIEMFLHRIPFLAEKFIYTNDDIIFLESILARYFYEGDMIKTTLEKHDQDGTMPVWKQIAINSYKLIFEHSFFDCYLVPPHVEHGFRKSILEKVYKEFEPDILNSITRFRSSKNLNQYIYDFYAVRHKLNVDGFHSRTCINNACTKDKLDTIFAKGKDGLRRWRSIGYNDVGGSSDPYFLEKLQETFPEKSKYEI